MSVSRVAYPSQLFQRNSPLPPVLLSQCSHCSSTHFSAGSLKIYICTFLKATTLGLKSSPKYFFLKFYGFTIYKGFAFISSLKYPLDWMLKPLKRPLKLSFSPKTSQEQTIPSSPFKIDHYQKNWIPSCAEEHKGKAQLKDKNNKRRPIYPWKCILGSLNHSAAVFYLTQILQSHVWKSTNSTNPQCKQHSTQAGTAALCDTHFHARFHARQCFKEKTYFRKGCFHP